VTTLAKVEANRRNGELSTGPRTVEGKVIVARNAMKHGIFAAVPVVPGECPEAWEAHRAGVVDSLGPVGLLEINLAERAALLLWRLQRLARYEAETVAIAMEDLEVPPLPTPKDSFPPPVSTFPTMSRVEQLRDIREDLRSARKELAEVMQARNFFTSETEGGIAFEVAESVLDIAYERAESAEGRRSAPPAFNSKAFFRKLGHAETDPQKVSWTPDLIQRGIAFYAAFAHEAHEYFRDAVAAALAERADDVARQVKRLESEVVALVRLLDGQTARKQAAKLLPTDGRDERIAKYERHLHNLLTSTLHELERLQARRSGQAVAPPAVADVTVTVDAGAN